MDFVVFLIQQDNFYFIIGVMNQFTFNAITLVP